MEPAILTFPQTKMEIMEQTLFSNIREETPTLFSSIQPWNHKGNLLGKNPVNDDLHIMRAQLTFHPYLSTKFYPFPFLARPSWKHPWSLVKNSRQILRKELSLLNQKPKAVYINPVGDPFYPALEIQNEVAGIVQVLAEQGIQSWLLTRGFIRPTILQMLADYADHIQIMVGVTTMDHSHQRTLEPFCCPPWRRIKQIQKLKSLGISVQVALEPLIPGITDTKENLIPVLDALSDMGITHVTAGYLYIPQKTQDALRRDLPRGGWENLPLDAFRKSTLWRTGTLANCRLLPKSVRQQGYASLIALASHYNIRVGISSFSNPDFTRNSSLDRR